jgi:hypothetical protein
MYSREISRQYRGLFIFLLDQSFSMEEPLGNSQNRKMDELALAINGWLQNMVIRSTGSEGVKNYMDIAVIGYRTDMEANAIIESPLAEVLKDRLLVPINEIADHPIRIDKKQRQILDDETGELMQTEVEVPVWVEAFAEGGTPMCSALYKAHELASQWIESNSDSFPPVVIHITDGESQEGDPLPYAEPLKDLETSDGNVLLFNCHLSMTPADSFLFPSSEEILPDDLARVLFRMSSPLPEPMAKRALAEGFELQPGARGMAFNADMVALIKFLDMGTRVALR